MEADKRGWSVSTSPGCDSKQEEHTQLIQCPIRIPAESAWNAAVRHLWHTVPLAGFPAPGNAFSFQYILRGHLVWVLWGGVDVCECV